MDRVFTLELHGLQAEIGKVSFRLQRDRRWRLLLDLRHLVDADYRTEAPADITSQSPRPGSTLSIDGVEYQVNPASIPLEASVLVTGSRCFRRGFPARPSRAQLRLELAARDPGRPGVLVLDADGKFCWRDIGMFESERNDPTVVLRYPASEADADPAAIHAEGRLTALYEIALEGWLFHLKEGWTQIHASLFDRKVSGNAAQELSRLESSWRPGF